MNGGIEMQESKDLYSEFYTPNNLGVIGSLIGLVTFVIVANFSSTSAPFFSAMAVAVLSMLMGLLWPLRRRCLLWFLLILILIIHIILIIFIPLPNKISFAFAFSPLFAVEIYALWKFIIFVMKKLDVGK